MARKTTSKKKTTKKTTKKKSSSRPSTRKTTSKKTTSKKKASSRAATSKKKTTKKKAASKKKTTSRAAASKKKTSSKKKTTSKKKTATRAAASKKKTTSKKKATTKKKAASSKKTTSKKTTSKKTASKKTTSKKTTSKKKVTAASSSKKTTSKKTTSKKSSSKKTTAKKSGKVPKGRSVAEVASASDADAQGYVYVNGRRIRMISTKGIPAVKKTRSTTKVQAQEPEKAVSNIKTKLTAKQLRHYKERLLLKRREIVGDLDAMETQALRSGGGNLSTMPIHMADIGSDTYDQDFMLGMAESERKVIREIDDALKRIMNKTYGVCQMTGEAIPIARLDAKPWAKYTVEAARKLENQWGA